jgi:hypothetical protein
MHDYDVVIIGGGIAGLTVAFQLCQTTPQPRILILEKSHHWGGKINTLYLPNTIPIELCASRFSPSLHKELFLIMTKLGFDLQHDLDKIKPDTRYALRTCALGAGAGFESQGKKYKLTFVERQLLRLGQRLFQIGAQLALAVLPEALLMNRTPRELLREFGFSEEFVHILQDMFHYDSPWDLINSLDGMRFVSHLFPAEGFFRFRPGLTQLIHRMTNFLEQHGVELRLDAPLLHFHCDSQVYVVNQVRARSVVFAVPATALNKLIRLPCGQAVTPVTPVALIRIFLFYPSSQFVNQHKDIPHLLVTFTPIRALLNEDPYSPANMLQIYADAPVAFFWERERKAGRLCQTIRHYLSCLFPQWEVPDPDHIVFHFVPEAVHYWRKGADSEKISARMIQPWRHKGIFVCGESYSMMQGWTEGAVRTANKVAKRWKLYTKERRSFFFRSDSKK